MLAIAGIAALVAFVPLALASDVFTDVPTSHPFHDQINRAYAAGMIGACAGSPPPPNQTFCPGNYITKGSAANQYDKAFGLDGTPRPFTPTWRSVNIQTGGSTAPLTVDSSQKVDNLNSDQLDGLHANELGRLAFNHFVFPTVPNPGGTVASTTITTSQPQELVDVNASFYIYSFDTTAANFPCQPLFTLSLDGGSLDTYLPFNIATPSPGTSVYDVSTGQTAQLVGPGVHTVGLVYGGYINPRYCSFSIGKGTLRAQSWQFAGDGSAPASSARASTRSKTPGLTK